MNKIVLITLITLSASLSTLVEAKCRKAHVCDDYGQNCQVQQTCDSQLDLPSIEVTPIQPLPSTRIKPLPSTTLPPLGTSRCQYKQVNGVWQNVCT
ncbi:hypothetical protein [Pseudocolwellia agarivorans]|uniref:hypothetical protein n=1 Tax=Pseudocolwellia agarivorans TaxID=1911682 RepID=UPI003F882216